MKRLLIILLLVVPLAVFGQLDTINIGSSANSGTGESLRSAMLKTNRVIKRLNTLELHNVTSAIQTQLNAKAPLASPALTGTPTVATTLNPDANDGATLGQSGTAFSDAYFANGGVIDFNEGQATISHTASQEEIVITGNVEVTGRLEPGSIYVTSTGATISQTELDALDGVTGSLNYSTENYGATGTGDIVFSTGPTLTTVNITDVIKLTPTASPPAGATEGMIYADTDHHLYYHNGTTWVQID